MHQEISLLHKRTETPFVAQYLWLGKLLQIPVNESRVKATTALHPPLWCL